VPLGSIVSVPSDRDAKKGKRHRKAECADTNTLAKLNGFVNRNMAALCRSTSFQITGIGFQNVFILGS
jgi:hypothetical protein